MAKASFIENAKKNKQALAFSESGGDFVYETPPAGKTVARFVEYVELGKHMQKPNAYKKTPYEAEEIRIVFELLGSKHIREEEINGEKRTFANRITINLTKSLSKKSKYFSLFQTMAGEREDVDHFVDMLGEGFIVDVIHTANKTDATKVYAGLYKDKVWKISAPVMFDPVNEVTTAVPVREAIGAMRLFLFDTPAMDQWDSLFIDGMRTVKDDKGNEREVSKNTLQEKILRAINLKDSAVYIMLMDSGAGIPEGALEAALELTEETQVEEEEEEVAEEPKATKTKAKATTKAKDTTSAADAAKAALAAMDLDL